MFKRVIHGSFLANRDNKLLLQREANIQPSYRIPNFHGPGLFVDKRHLHCSQETFYPDFNLNIDNTVYFNLTHIVSFSLRNTLSYRAVNAGQSLHGRGGNWRQQKRGSTEGY